LVSGLTCLSGTQDDIAVVIWTGMPRVDFDLSRYRVGLLLLQVRNTLSPRKLEELTEQLAEVELKDTDLLETAILSKAEPPHVRAAALAALLQSHPEKARVFLLAALQDTEARVREVAAGGAAAFISDRLIAAALHRIVQEDPSNVIRAIAADSLNGS